MLDSDDWWMPTKLQEMVDHMESHKELLWCAHCVVAHYPKGLTYETVWPGKTYGIGGVAAILFRRNCLSDIKERWGYIFNPNMDRADDADLVLRVRNDPSDLIPQFLSHYRWNLEGLSANTDGVKQSWILVDMCIRNKAYDFLPYHMKELAINWVNQITGIDWVAEKKEVTRMKSHLEFTTIIGNGNGGPCYVNCKRYCPQEIIVEMLGGVTPKILPLDDFKNLLSTISKDVGIIFGGVSEPFQNPGQQI